jgi:anti-anti-sigma regulatory factor
MKDALYFGMRLPVLLFVAKGEMRAGDAFAADEYIRPYITGKEGGITVVFDLSQCTYMDSTFIGFIVSLERLSESSKLDTLIILRPSIQCRSAMKKLSVLPHLSLSNDDTPDIPVFALEKDPAAFKQKKNVALMFEAHKTLSDLSSENRMEFSALLEELAKVLEKK